LFAVFIYYGATTLGVFILRRKMPDAPRPYKVWGLPNCSAIVILFCIGLFVNTIRERPREAGIGMALMLTECLCITGSKRVINNWKFMITPPEVKRSPDSNRP
jgi:amino acid transporter